MATSLKQLEGDIEHQSASSALLALLSIGTEELQTEGLIMFGGKSDEIDQENPKPNLEGVSPQHDGEIPSNSDSTKPTSKFNCPKFLHRQLAIKRWREKRTNRKWFRKDPRHGQRRLASERRNREHGKFQKSHEWIPLTEFDTMQNV